MLKMTECDHFGGHLEKSIFILAYTVKLNKSDNKMIKLQCLQVQTDLNAAAIKFGGHLG